MRPRTTALGSILPGRTSTRLAAIAARSLSYKSGISCVLAEDITRILPFPVAATRSKGVYIHVLGTVLASSGVRDLFFPILLGGLVIFGTMLGSVADREKEIYTFSALGLAPKHVAMLFLMRSTERFWRSQVQREFSTPMRCLRIFRERSLSASCSELSARMTAVHQTAAPK